MGQRPTPSTGGQNQTLLELIFALKGLAQALEYMHSDVRRLLQDEGRDRSQDMEKLAEICNKNAQALAVLPITISDRVEKLLDKQSAGVDKKIDGVLDGVKVGLGAVQDRLIRYAEQVGDKDNKQAIPLLRPPEDDRTGSFEILKDGDVKIGARLPMKKIWMVLKWGGLALASVGGVTGLIKLFVDYFRGP